MNMLETNEKKQKKVETQQRNQRYMEEPNISFNSEKYNNQN